MGGGEKREALFSSHLIRSHTIHSIPDCVDTNTNSLMYGQNTRERFERVKGERGCSARSEGKREGKNGTEEKEEKRREKKKLCRVGTD